MRECGRSGVTVLPLESPLAAVGRSPLISALFAPELAAGVTVFELARIMGTSVRMIERHYGALLDGAHAGISGRLDAVELALEQAAAATATAAP